MAGFIGRRFIREGMAGAETGHALSVQEAHQLVKDTVTKKPPEFPGALLY